MGSTIQPMASASTGCQINVEICTSVKSIKYVLKYIHNGNDQATFLFKMTQNTMKSRILSMPDSSGALRVFGEFSNFQFMNVFQVLFNWPSIF